MTHPETGHGSQPWEAFPPPAARIRRRRRVRPAVAALLVAGAGAASVGAGHYLWPAAARSTALAADGGSSPAGGGSPYYSAGGGSPSTGGSASTGSAAGTPADAASVAAQVAPGLVDINTTFGYQSASGAGTGIVLTPDGEILTNNHVIAGATSIRVTDIGNGRTYQATVVGYDRSADVAVLKLQGASGLKTARLADSASVRVGQPVVAVGNAGGTGGQPSSAGGSVTALGQAITAGDELTGTSEQLSGLIEVDADVQPGDSGGPLVDTAGRVIGMDTAASTGYSLQSASSQGFAIPIDTALTLAHQIEAGRSSATVHVGATAFLGVGLSSGSSSGVPSGSAGGFGYGPGGGDPGGYSSAPAGAPVSSVVTGGPAATAGLQAGDTITSVNGRAVSGASALSAAISQDHPGDRVQLGWTDSSGVSHTAVVILGSGPPA